MKKLSLILRQYSIRLRMWGAITMVLALFAFVGAVGLLGGGKVKALSDRFIDNSAHETETLAAAKAHLSQVRLLEKQMVIDYEDGVQVLKLREAWQLEVVATNKALERLIEGGQAAEKALAHEAVKRLAAYAERSKTVLDNIQNGGYDNARTADRMLARAKEEVAAVESALASVAGLLKAKAGATRGAVEEATLLVTVTFIAALAVVVVLVWPLTILNSRSITGPIDYAVSVAEAIANGDLTTPIRLEGRDETARLLASLQRMQLSLSRIVGQVQASSQGIHVASAEVASGNGDLSQRTEQSAAALQQTASSMEQLTAAVRQSAESAQLARDLATTARDVAQRGGDAVAQVVATMDQINTSSRRIADIVATIDGIAFQTNILALNAAVEAARAGEQGRGFAVVASEVRSLAGRSAEAAREIKSLIGASVERVEAGAHQVATAGQTMAEIVDSVQRVSQIVGEISAAATEQSSGIGQVNQSVAQLDRSTQQNAALVEESSAAADSLKDQAARLSDVVSTFKLQPAAA